jgi:hypothetical protein
MLFGTPNFPDELLSDCISVCRGRRSHSRKIIVNGSTIAANVDQEFYPEYLEYCPMNSPDDATMVLCHTVHLSRATLPITTNRHVPQLFVNLL